jgi:anti-sigma B factor antagonist
MDMSKERPVVVMQLPERLNLPGIQRFLREVEPLLQADRPRIVFDFSQVQQLDSAGVEMLLHCMEKVMKQDGDLKLAAVPPKSAVILELTRVDRLFETFQKTSDAIESFQSFPLHLLHGPHAWYAASGNGNGNGNEELKLAS